MSRFYVDKETSLNIPPRVKIVYYNKSTNECIMINKSYKTTNGPNPTLKFHHTIVKLDLTDDSRKAFNEFVEKFEGKYPRTLFTVFDNDSNKGVVRDELKDFMTLISTDVSVIKLPEAK
jgi:hypothetical protein